MKRIKQLNNILKWFCYFNIFLVFLYLFVKMSIGIIVLSFLLLFCLIISFLVFNQINYWKKQKSYEMYIKKMELTSDYNFLVSLIELMISKTDDKDYVDLKKSITTIQKMISSTDDLDKKIFLIDTFMEVIFNENNLDLIDFLAKQDSIQTKHKIDKDFLVKHKTILRTKLDDIKK